MKEIKGVIVGGIDEKQGKPLQLPRPPQVPTHNPHPVFAAAKQAIAEERKRPA